MTLRHPHGCFFVGGKYGIFDTFIGIAAVFIQLGGYFI